MKNDDDDDNEHAIYNVPNIWNAFYYKSGEKISVSRCVHVFAVARDVLIFL